VRTSDFDYDLPPDRIAQEPLAEREASRLLVLDRSTGALLHRSFRDLPSLLDPRDLVVINTTRVLPARLLGTRAGGGAAEVLLVRRLSDDEWEALLKPGRRLRIGDVVRVDADLTVTVESSALGADARRRVRLRSSPPLSAALERAGRVPLPPYVRRPPRPEDRDRYQTVYAAEPGSVAAPTAGLHFAESTLRALGDRGIAVARVTLHVGPGTFRPVKVTRVEDHRVDPEPFSVSASTADAVRDARRRGGRVVAVGTTTVRALESVATAEGLAEPVSGETDCVIVPGFRFRVTDALLTNFHLPRSSLLLLVCAFAGREPVLRAYREAVRTGYRFYSYGDAMLLL
jgi:S-adenosylmethionine:tRNA ribosyltransferase-isomerase